MRRDDWLSDSIGFSAFEFTPDNKIKYLKEPNLKHFIYSKLFVNDIKNIRMLEDNNFRLIDTSILLRKEIKSVNFKKVKNIYIADIKDKQQIIDIAVSSLTYSRFHLDPLIDNNIADNIKRRWVENYFVGNRGNVMLVSKIGKKILGFLLINNDIVIDLIAVLEDYRNCGIGGELINYMENIILHNKKKYIKVSTQITNLDALHFYQSLGFKITDFKYVFHYHKI